MNAKTTASIRPVLWGAILLLTLLLILPCRAWASTADELQESLLGTLSARYESNGNPGCISDGSDAGGKSYGAYQFASAYDVPLDFARWCRNQPEFQDIGNTLYDAYYLGGAGYGNNFDTAWRSLASNSYQLFLKAQHDYVMASYYSACVTRVKVAATGFDLNNYSIALRNVIWSRAVQHGVGYYRSDDDKSGATGLIVAALGDLGTRTPSEMDLIDAIYARSCALSDTGYYAMYGAAARRYGVEGKSLDYFSGNSGGIQLGVYQRLRYDEPADAHLMLAQYGGADTAHTGAVSQMAVYAGCYPTFACQLTPGNSYFPFGGVLRGPNPLSSVSAAIVRADGTVCSSGTVYPGTTYCDLNQLDGSMLYSTLSGGEYITRISAVDSTGATFLLEQGFLVGQSGRWEQSGGTWYYVLGDGSYATGWLRIDGTWYYFNPSGAMRTGWLQDGSDWYYFKSSGAMAVEWLEIDGTWYYFNSDGTMRTGWLQSGDLWYYLKSSGAMAVKWARIDGTWYYFSPSGIMRTGWLQDGGQWYFFDSSGHMVTGWLQDGEFWYYFNADGAMRTGWLEDGGSRYYFKSSGQMAVGLLKIGSDWHYFDEDGIWRESVESPVGWGEINGSWYYFDEDGSMITGWIQDGAFRYYLLPSGQMATGWQQIDGVTYYFLSGGQMATGWREIDGEWYYFSDSGALHTGWLQDGGKTYYFRTDGVMATGWQEADGTWYYFNPSGSMRTGWLQYGTQRKWYFFDENGAMHAGWLQDGGKWYYFNADGTMCTGWLQYGTQHKWYYFNGSGAMRTGWLNLNGDWYDLKDDGTMATGWQKIGDVWYYFFSSGVMAHDRWVGNYYLLSNGAMATNQWIGNYHVGEDGQWDGTR